MYVKDTKSKKRNNIIIISILSVAMLIIGYNIGVEYNVGVTGSKINELENKIENLKNENKGFNNITYLYDESSLSDIYKSVIDSIVEISGMVTYQSFFTTQIAQVQGSGFVYSYNDEMLVITNCHVVNDAFDIIVTFSNGNSYTAETVGLDAYSDLAILSVDAPQSEFITLEIVSSSSLEIGDPVIAIGNPMGLDGTMTTGIVSQLKRTLDESLAGNFAIANIIQTSVPINPGNSGGPLLNYLGEVVGITTAIIEDSEGLGFAIPSNTILEEIDSLVETGSYNQHAWLGISGTDMTYSIAELMNVNVTYGWLIADVVDGGAAYNAGLKGGNEQVRLNDEWKVIGGDIIIGIDGNRIISGDDFMSYLQENTVSNQTISITIIRDHEVMDFDVILGTRPMLT